MTIQIEQTKDTCDSNNVFYYDSNNNKIGYAYQSKKNQRIHILKCPSCGGENYGLARAYGNCYKCEFDPNENSNKNEN